MVLAIGGISNMDRHGCRCNFLEVLEGVKRYPNHMGFFSIVLSSWLLGVFQDDSPRIA